MLTRAYYTLKIVNTMFRVVANESFNNGKLGDAYINCRDVGGNIINPVSAYAGKGFGAYINVLSNIATPFISWDHGIGKYSVGGTNCTNIQPMETDKELNYEDYATENSGYIGSINFKPVSSNYTYSLTYDSENHKFINTVSLLYQNIASETKTIYGVYCFQKKQGYLTTATTISSSNACYYLIAEQKLDTPITVEAGGYVNLSFSWSIDSLGNVEA